MSKTCQYIGILGGMGGDVHGIPYIFCSLFEKTEKVQEKKISQGERIKIGRCFRDNIYRSMR